MKMERTSPEASALLLFIGIILIFIGAVIVMLGFAPGGEARGGGVILIGPIPIIFHGEISPLLAILLMILPLLIFLILLAYFMRKTLKTSAGSD